MVDTLIAAAALAAATNQANAIEGLGGSAGTTSGDQVRRVVPVDRRKVARATNPTDDLASLKPLVQRARLNASLAEAKTLLDKAEKELKTGRREQAMLTLDGAGVQIESIRPKASGDASFLDTFLELERRESRLREKLGQPRIVPVRPAPAKDGEDAAPAEEKKDEVKPPKRDELPVG